MSNTHDVATFDLASIEQAVEVGTTLSGSWFRGHARVYAELTPSVFRETVLAQMSLPTATQDRAAAAEAYFVQGFRLKAPSVEAKLPGTGDHLSWLFLMQHHGTPTRLLDWTENLLVALYFTVRDAREEDGELWAVAHAALAQAAGLPAIPAHDSVLVNYLAAQGMLNEPEHVGAAYDDSQLLPLPIYPPLSFPRMVSQASAFTIHPKPLPGNAIPDLLHDEKFLVRYIVRADAKKRLRDDLAALGINQLVLFPDLDGLSVSLRQEAQRPQWQPQAPPRWNT